MFAVIHIPVFSLQSVLRHEPDLIPKPVVLTDPALTKPCVTQLTPAARASGICAGMTPSQAMARCGNLVVKTRSLSQEHAAMETLMQTAYAFSPHIEATAPGVCTIELKGLGMVGRASTRADEPLHQWAVEILRVLKQFHLAGQIGFAETPPLALLAAHAARPVLVGARPSTADANTHWSLDIGAFLGFGAWDLELPSTVHGKEKDFVSTLPIEALNLPFESLEILKRWGINTAGAFLALGKDQLAERLGPAIVEVFDRLSTQSIRPLKIASPPETFAEEIEFEKEIETLEPLLFILRRFVEQLSRRIELLYLVVAELHLKLGLTSGATYERAFTIPSPTGNAETLFRVLHTHLETVRTDAPIMTLRLSAKPGRSESHQFGLFETTLRNPNQFAETLARLTALCGSDRVGTPAAEQTHRPDTFQMKPPDFTIPKGLRPSAQGCEGGQSGSDRATLGSRRRVSTTLKGLRHGCEIGKSGSDRASRIPHSAFGNQFPSGLPLRRFRPPLPARIEIRERHPVLIRSAVFNGVIADVHGPFLSSGNWWENNRWWREEWDIQTADGNLYRIFRPAEEVGETVGRACSIRVTLASPTTTLDSNAHAPSPKSGIGLPHSKTLREPDVPHQFRQVLECGSPMPLSTDDPQSSESFTDDSEKLSLTPCFSGVHERPKVGINCFNSFSTDSGSPQHSPMSDAASQSNPPPLHYFIEGIYD